MLRRSLILLLAAISLMQCRRRGEPIRSSSKLKTIHDRSEHMLYVAQCKRELGIAGESLPDLNCFDGVEVPITVGGKKLSAKNFEDAKAGLCDHKQLLPRKCYPYDFLQVWRSKKNPNVVMAANCRQKYFTTHLTRKERLQRYLRAKSMKRLSPDEEVKLWREIYEFNDLGIIITNQKTGKTCYFGRYATATSEVTFNGAWIPSLDRGVIDEGAKKRLAKKDPHAIPPKSYKEKWYLDSPSFFFEPKQMHQCMNCHDNGPFIHTPFIDQAKDKEGNVLLPLDDQNVPYLPVRKDFQEHFRKTQKFREVDTDKIKGSDQECTGCHRITSGGSTCSSYIDDSTAHFRTATTLSLDNIWMPPGHGGQFSIFDYLTTYKDHVQAIKCCCQNPERKGCRSRAFGPTLKDVGGDYLKSPWIKGTKSPSCIP